MKPPINHRSTTIIQIEKAINHDIRHDHLFDYGEQGSAPHLSLALRL